MSGFDDRFMVFQFAVALSADLEKAGFSHVLTHHRIDPVWRQQYRPQQPELDGVSCTIRLMSSSIPMPRIKALIEVCERHHTTFWLGGSSGEWEEGSGPEIYVRVQRIGQP